MSWVGHDQQGSSSSTPCWAFVWFCDQGLSDGLFHQGNKRTWGILKCFLFCWKILLLWHKQGLFLTEIWAVTHETSSTDRQHGFALEGLQWGQRQLWPPGKDNWTHTNQSHVARIRLSQGCTHILSVVEFLTAHFHAMRRGRIMG